MGMKDFVQNVQEYSARGQDYTYVELSDSGSGASATLVSGLEDKYIKLVGFIISVDGAGKVEIKVGNDIVMHLEFSQRTTLPVYVPFPILVDKGLTVSVTFTADNAPAMCYITTVYHYETIE